MMSPDLLSRQPSRRHFLRGMGVALALPWMESLPVLGQAAAVSKTNTPPLRLGIVFFSNGVEPIHWWAKGQGAAMELGPGLTPMLPHRGDMVFLQGLYNQSALSSTSPHLGRMNVLSGAPVSLDPNEIRVGTSMDQILASQIGSRTAIPSLVLGVEPNELRLEDGLSMIYGSSVSWISPTKPATKEIYPSRTFDRLVGDGTGRPLDRSILDAVQQDSKSLTPKISRDDNRKLSEYFESIRDIEQRIERASTRGTDRRLAPDADPARHAAPGQRAAAERAGSHEADARPHRPRVPDGQDAGRDADAEQRPVADELQVPRRRAGRAAPRSDAQRPRPPRRKRCT